MSDTKVPFLKTRLPGPRAAALIAEDRKYLSPSYTRDYPLTVKRARGAVIEDMDGNRFLDFTAGIAVCSTGHCHPRIVKAIRRQANTLIHMSGTDFYYPQQVTLAKKLAEVAPGRSPKRVFFTNSGAESVEAAFKLARFHSKKHRVIAFHGAFHGRTMGALSLTASKVRQQERFGPLVPGVTHVPYGNVDFIENILFHKMIPPNEVAAIIVEPIQGEGGYIVPPQDFHRKLKKIAERHNILYIVDEVQSGMGRTGKMFAIEHFGIEPDIICLAKGIASGLPLGAIIARKDVMDWMYGSHASTFGGNPVSCAAALETIKLLEESLMENAAKMGALLVEKLKALQAKHSRITDVRGMGLMVAADFKRSGKNPARAKAFRNDIILRCFKKGLLLLGCGECAVRFCPPLVITEKQVETAAHIFNKVLSEI